MSREEKIPEIVHSGAVSAVQEEPTVRRDKTGGGEQADCTGLKWEGRGAVDDVGGCCNSPS